MAGRKKQTPEKFEDLLSRLEDIVEKLENEDTDLEEALKAFEEGVGLSAKLNSRLNQAEEKIELLLKNAAGDLETTPLGNRPGLSPANGAGEEDDIPF